MNEDPEGYALPGNETLEEMLIRLTGIDIRKCPKCGKGRMVQVYELLPEHFDYIVPTSKKETCNTS
jgi:predicted transcriptional regulator